MLIWRRITSTLILLTLCVGLSAQKVINQEFFVDGDISLTDDISIPKINPGYTVWLPENGNIKGLIVFTHPRRDTSQQDALITYALFRQLAVLYATTENRLEFFFKLEKLQQIENYLAEVIHTYQIPEANLLYCGMSLEGTRALKLAIFGQSYPSKHHIQPKAIAICDAPLDMVRFHKSMIRAKELNFNPITANEGNWVAGYLEKNLGGTPTDNLAAFTDYSPYCYTLDGGHHLNKFQEIAIRAYSEPDVNWWMQTRRKDFYSMNTIDLAAFINELNILGNSQAQLITTQNKGYHPDGNRHPHSWSIVDEKEMIDWFLSLLED